MTGRFTGPARAHTRARASAAVLAGALAGLLLACAVPATDASAASVPYSDAKSIGGLTLCGAANTAVSAGSLDQTPFVSRVVGSTAAPGRYAAAGRSATLYAFQPRPGVPPAEWSGEMLTSTSRYTNAAAPMAQATGGDISLRDFVEAYPPRLDGIVQLRLYLGAPGLPVYAGGYETADVQVTGSSWRVLRGAVASCTAGSATSLESVVLPKSQLTAPGTAAAAHAASAPAQAGGGHQQAGANPAAPGDVTAAAAVQHRGGGGGAPAWALGLGVGVPAAALAAFLLLRRRARVRPADTASADLPPQKEVVTR